MEALLDKYADEGIENMENIEVLTVPPINEFGSVTEIIKIFGSRDNTTKPLKNWKTNCIK
ncbi:MAG: hypothetical protein U5K51_13750 [Flavobacteriaceae bacterium]|nr:hypothetical protein [Flavobacteriaceae bacterium]